MKTIEAAKARCRFVGEGIEKDIAEGKYLGERFEGMPRMRFKVERDGGKETVAGGELVGGDSGIAVSESGVTNLFGAAVRATAVSSRP